MNKRLSKRKGQMYWWRSEGWRGPGEGMARKHTRLGKEKGRRGPNMMGWICLLFIIMAALCNRAGHYIFALWSLLLSSIYLLIFPRLISAVADWMSTILPHMVWP